jgi:hypothetical protein
VQLNKMTAQEFGSLTPAGTPTFKLPNWQDGNWTNFMANTAMGSMPIDQAQSKLLIMS